MADFITSLSKAVLLCDGATGFGTRSSADNYEDGDGNPVHSFYTRWSGTAIGGWTPNDDTRVEISADRSDGEAAYADRGMDGVKFDRTGYGARYVPNNVSERIEKIEAKVYRNYVDHVMDNYSLRTPATMKRVSNPDRTTDGARVAMKFSMGASASTTVGVDYQSNEHTLRKASAMTIPDINSQVRNKDASFKSTGLFTETDYSAGERDRIIGGVRADWTEATAENVMALYGGAPPLEEALAQLGGCAAFAGDPLRISVRFDSVVFWEERGAVKSNLEFFPEVADTAAALGVRDIRTSFAQWYGKAKRRAGIRGFRFVDPSDVEKADHAAALARDASARGLTLFSCCQPFLAGVPGIKPSACIDAGLIGALHPGREPASPRKDRSQRAGCLCTESQDIGSYTQACPHGCVYCYANPIV